MIAARAHLCDGFAFVQHPAQRGHWIRTDRSVVFVPCSYEHCRGHEPGIPCSGKNGFGGGTHVTRRADYKRYKKFLRVWVENPAQIAYAIDRDTQYTRYVSDLVKRNAERFKLPSRPKFAEREDWIIRMGG